MRFRGQVLLPCLLALSIRTAALEPPASEAGHRRTIAYHLSLQSSVAHEFHVSIGVDAASGEELSFLIPAWTPGYYQILDYQHGILHVGARDESGRSVAVTHPEARTWSVTAPSGASHRIMFDYDVDADDPGLGFFGSSLDRASRQGFINGASAFLYLKGHTADPVRLSVDLPKSWDLVVPLSTVGDRTWTSSQPYSVPNYDTLIDSPLQLGKFDEIGFRTDGIPFRCILAGKHHADLGRLAANLRRIAHVEFALFGSAPFHEYTFFYHVGGAGFTGGLEHRNSAVIHVMAPLRAADDDLFLSISAHELFHAWNVKWLRPAGLGPFDYTQPVRTPSLWWAEGVTDYYALLAMVRAGLRDSVWLRTELSSRIAELDSDAARLRVTLEEASRKAWEGGSEGYDGLSYYLKGSLVGFYLDLRVRALTRGEKGLDDVIRRLASKYAASDLPYPDDAIVEALDGVAHVPMEADYERCVRSTSEIQWSEALGPAGLVLRHGQSSFLGVEVESASSTSATSAAAGARVAAVTFDSPAYRMGLRVGDVIRTIGSRSVDMTSLPAAIESQQAGSSVAIVVERRGEAVTLKGVLDARSSDPQLDIAPAIPPGAAAFRIRQAIFGRFSPATTPAS